MNQQPSGPGAQPDALRRSKPSLLLIVVLLLWGLTVAIFVLLPSKACVLAIGKTDSAPTEDWGQVKQIRFIGSPGPSTQIETDRKTILVFGGWSIDRGAQLERRRSFMTDQVCVVGTDECRELASKP